MPLIFKLVKSQHDNKTYEFYYPFIGNLSLDLLIKMFIFLDLSIEEIQNIKFIIDSEQINDPTKFYPITSENTQLIFIFSNNTLVKNKLQTLFIKIGNDGISSHEQSYSHNTIKIGNDEILTREQSYSHNTLDKIVTPNETIHSTSEFLPQKATPFDETLRKHTVFSKATFSEKSLDFLENETSSFFLKKKDEITLGEILSPNETIHSTSEFLPPPPPPPTSPIIATQLSALDTPSLLVPELINKINVKTLELFSDPDFKNLMRIYINKPELFNYLSQYIQTGNIIEESLTQDVTLDTLTLDEQEYYSSLLKQIKDLNLGISDEIIMLKLIKYSGHLNLTVRSILYDSVKNK
jgi:hypothetical protein